MLSKYDPPSLGKARQGFASALDDGAKAHQLQLKQNNVGALLKELYTNIWNSTIGAIKPEWQKTATASAEKVQRQVLQRANPKADAAAIDAMMKDSDQVGKAVKNSKGSGIIRSALTSPLRVASRHPRLALLAGAGAGLMYMNNRHNREQQLEQLRQYGAANMDAQPVQNGYYNSVSPDEYAAMEAQMRQSPGMQGGFANREMARRAEAEALAAGQATPPSA